MARSAIRFGNEIEKLASLGPLLWQKGRRDFKIDFLESRHRGEPRIMSRAGAGVQVT